MISKAKADLCQKTFSSHLLKLAPKKSYFSPYQVFLHHCGKFAGTKVKISILFITGMDLFTSTVLNVLLVSSFLAGIWVIRYNAEIYAILYAPKCCKSLILCLVNIKPSICFLISNLFCPLPLLFYHT